MAGVLMKLDLTPGQASVAVTGVSAGLWVILNKVNNAKLKALKM